jgi:ribonuclease HI
LKEIQIFTDGSCNNHTHNNGGCGIVLKYGEHEKHIALGQFISTTSARMEIRAVLEALRLITNKTIPIKLYCDNEYVVKSINEKWVYKWENEYWINKVGMRVNHDLWKQVLVELRSLDNITFIWVKGHNGNKYNEICDKLANKGAHSNVMIDDNIDIINR